MLFTSNKRRSLDHNNDLSKTALDSARLLARKRANLTRRHTCSALVPEETILSSHEYASTSRNKLLRSGIIRQVQFVEPGTDRVILVDATHLFSRSSSIKSSKEPHLRYTRRSVGNVIRYVTVYISQKLKKLS